MHQTDISRIATTRHSCKAFDPARRIAPAVVEAIKTLLRYTPSSVNSQPWHFVLAGSAPGKEKIAATLAGRLAYNAPKVRDASHVAVLCVRREMDDAHLNALIEQETADGRFATPEARSNQYNARGFYADLHREQLRDADQWMEKQVYIALGNLLLGAATLGLDACPMEGIDHAAIDTALGLEARGLRCVLLVALGYRSGDDFNAALPKSRLPEAAVISEI
jgi:nitroreductase/dihydropteridine reductase